jgi:chromate reductase
MADTIKLVGFSGSLRKDSLTAAILRTLAEKVGPEIELAIAPIHDIPLYNQDNDGDASPASVKTLRQHVTDADGVFFVTPEYNYGVPGVMKNIVDWLSRPAYKSCLIGKHFALISASMAFTGGVRAQAQLRESLMAALAIPAVMPETVIGAVHDKVKDGKLTDQTSLDFAVKAVKSLAEAINKAK